MGQGNWLISTWFDWWKVSKPVKYVKFFALIRIMNSYCRNTETKMSLLKKQIVQKTISVGDLKVHTADF